jgi:hypothetical protein
VVAAAARRALPLLAAVVVVVLVLVVEPGVVVVVDVVLDVVLDVVVVGVLVVVVGVVVVVVVVVVVGVVVVVVVGIGVTGAREGSDRASAIAPATLSSPAPCSAAGAPMSVAVLHKISLTRAGDGPVPWWAREYASITSAAAAAVSGEASLVPPKFSTPTSLPPRLSAQSVYCVASVEHRAQLASPGATRSMVLPDWV